MLHPINNKAIKIKPDYFEAYYGLGNVQFKMFKLEDALSNLDKAIQLRPSYLPALKSKVMLLTKMNRNQEALQLLNILISTLLTVKVVLFNAESISLFLFNAFI